jgi:hypothetical protein
MRGNSATGNPLRIKLAPDSFEADNTMATYATLACNHSKTLYLFEKVTHITHMGDCWARGQSLVVVQRWHLCQPCEGSAPAVRPTHFVASTRTHGVRFIGLGQCLGNRVAISAPPHLMFGFVVLSKPDSMSRFEYFLCRAQDPEQRRRNVLLWVFDPLGQHPLPAHTYTGLIVAKASTP